MNDALEDHKGSVNIGDRIFIKFRFADAIVVNAEDDGVVTIMDTTCIRYMYNIEIGPDKRKQ